MPSGNRKGRSAPRAQQPARRSTTEAVEDFQRSAFWNLRTRLANVSIVLGVLALLTVSLGSADGARLAPTLTCAVAGVCGAAVYFSRPYPALVKWLLIAATSLTLISIVWLALVVAAGA